MVIFHSYVSLPGRVIHEKWPKSGASREAPAASGVSAPKSTTPAQDTET